MTDSKGRPIADELLKRVAPDRRQMLRMVLGAVGAYAAPVVASFPLGKLSQARAQGYMTPQ